MKSWMLKNVVCRRKKVWKKIVKLEIDTLGTSGVVGGYWIPIMTICRSEGSALQQPPPNTKARKIKD